MCVGLGRLELGPVFLNFVGFARSAEDMLYEIVLVFVLLISSNSPTSPFICVLDVLRLRGHTGSENTPSFHLWKLKLSILIQYFKTILKWGALKQQTNTFHLSPSAIQSRREVLDSSPGTLVVYL